MSLKETIFQAIEQKLPWLVRDPSVGEPFETSRQLTSEDLAAIIERRQQLAEPIGNTASSGTLDKDF